MPSQSFAVANERQYQSILSSNGTVFRFNLVIKKRLETLENGSIDVCHKFGTPVHKTNHDIPEEYKKRWRIENNFKSVEQMRARTGSRNHSIRVFMFFLSMTVCNLWYTAVNMMESKRRRRVKINITAGVFWHCSLYWSKSICISKQGIGVLPAMCAIGAHFQLLMWMYSPRHKGMRITPSSSSPSLMQ